MAAYGIIMYVDIIFMTLYLGYSLGSAPIVSFHYGARNHAELKNLCRKSLVIISACGVILLTASQILAGPLVKIFANYDQELLEMTTWGFRIHAIAFMVRGMNVWGSSFFTALNNGAVSAAISFSAYFRVPDRHRADPAETDRHYRCMAVHRAGRVPGAVCDNRIPDRQEKKYHYA